MTATTKTRKPKTVAAEAPAIVATAPVAPAPAKAPRKPRAKKVVAPVVSDISDTEVEVSTVAETQTETTATEQAVEIIATAAKGKRKGAKVSEAPATVEVPVVEVEGEPEATEAEPKGPVCRMCGHPLSAELSVERGLGPLCASRAKTFLKVPKLGKEGEEGAVPETDLVRAIETIKATKTETIAPDDFNKDENVNPHFPEMGTMAFIPLRRIHERLVSEGRSISAFIKAFGGNRGMDEPIAWYWKPVYVGRTRYFPVEVQNHIGDIPLVRAKGAKATAPTTSPVGDVDEADQPATPEDTGNDA